MAEDQRNYMERSASLSEKATGREPTSDEFAGQFGKLGRAKRIEILESIDADLSSDEPVEFGTNGFKRLLKLRQQRQKLGGVHGALRRAGR